VEEFWTPSRLFLFNFVVLLAAMLHIDVIPLDQTGT
jgi:hypothetical protein